MRSITPTSCGTINLLLRFENIQIIVSDGGSTDGTKELLEGLKICWISTTTQSRAKRLAVGAAHALGELVLLHHPRSIIEMQGIEYLLQHAAVLKWGGFLHSFDEKHPLLQFTSWYSNNIRGKFKKIVYLDHCIFLHRSALNAVISLPGVDIFEDTVLSHNLSRLFGPPKIFPLSIYAAT